MKLQKQNKTKTTALKAARRFYAIGKGLALQILGRK